MITAQPHVKLDKTAANNEGLPMPREIQSRIEKLTNNEANKGAITKKMALKPQGLLIFQKCLNST